MANDAANVKAGLTGKVWAAPIGTPLPTDATTALDAAFVDLGYISADGVKQVPDRSTTDHKAWGGDVVKTTLDEHKVSFPFAMLESKAAVYQVYYGDETATNTAWTVKNVEGVKRSWVFESVDGTEVTRQVVPNGQVTGVDEVAFKTDVLTTYGVTVTAFPETGTEVKVYGYAGVI